MKFNRYKDREAVLKKASEVLDEDTSYSVRQDLTQRVKKLKLSWSKAKRKLGLNNIYFLYS